VLVVEFMLHLTAAASLPTETFPACQLYGSRTETPLPRGRSDVRSRRPLVEKLINAPRGFRTDTIDLHQVRD
jgi:hypothetical protein